MPKRYEASIISLENTRNLSFKDHFGRSVICFASTKAVKVDERRFSDVGSDQMRSALSAIRLDMKLQFA